MQSIQGNASLKVNCVILNLWRDKAEDILLSHAFD